MTVENKVLQGSGWMGDFVHSGQTMAAKEGFKCVSRLWWQKTKPISDGIQAIVDDAKHREDITVPISQVVPAMSSGGEVVMKFADGREFTPTDHAWRQISNWLFVPQTFYNVMTKGGVRGNKEVFQRDQKDRETFLAVYLNGYRRLDPNKEFLFRVRDNGSMIAMFSDGYACINNAWYLETLEKLFKEIGGTEPRLSHWRGNADTIYGNILIPDSCREDSDSDYGGMISISNCEIGRRVLSQCPSVFRAICMNGCIWDQSKGNVIRQVHKGEIDFDWLRERIVKNIHTQIPLLGDAVKRFLETKDLAFGKTLPGNIFALLAQENRLTGAEVRKVAEQFLEHEADNRNLFGLINAVTRAGQLFENDDWVRYDEIGGQLMNFNASKWENFLNRAGALEKEVVTDLLTVAA